MLVDAPCSGLGVLASRPTCAGAANRCRNYSATCCAWPRSGSSRAASVVYSVCTLNVEENEAIVDASGLEAESLRSEWPQFAHPRRPEFLLTRPASRPHVGVLHRPPKIKRMSWHDWIRTIEVEPSLYAADFSRLGEQIEVLLRAEVQVFHFDVGDGHFVPPITWGRSCSSRSRRSSTRGAACSTAI